MKKTKYFSSLPSHVTSILNDEINMFTLSSCSGVIRLNTPESRSVIFEIEKHNVIIKLLNSKGKNDSDIDALLDLEGINYFPKLYCHKEKDYLVMEKANGHKLTDLLRSKSISNSELCLIKDQYLDAVFQAVQKDRYDWDMKLEHFYWNKNNLMLIDMGLYDKYNLPKDGVVQECEKNFLDILHSEFDINLKC